MNIYLQKYYKNNIPLISKRSVYNDIKKSYYGGITEVYKPYGENLYYYDVNSLYPYAGLNPMHGLNCTYKENINKDIKDCFNELFGFYYSVVETNDQYLGLLPVRDKNDSIVNPNGYYEG
jgi:hypothetical protein